MRKLLFLIIPILFTTVPFVTQADEKDTTHAKPAVLAVMMYADWCGSCKSLDPKVSQARKKAELDTQDVLFVSLDLTNDTTKAQASMMAAALGISDVYEANAGKTGFMLLLDAETGEKVARLTNKLEAKEIASRIQEALVKIKS